MVYDFALVIAFGLLDNIKEIIRQYIFCADFKMKK